MHYHHIRRVCSRFQMQLERNSTIFALSLCFILHIRHVFHFFFFICDDDDCLISLETFLFLNCVRILVWRRCDLCEEEDWIKKNMNSIYKWNLFTRYLVSWSLSLIRIRLVKKNICILYDSWYFKLELDFILSFMQVSLVVCWYFLPW